MKRKHWQGYGTVNAKVVRRLKEFIIIEVKGEHECGLAINKGDKYTLAQWLGIKSLGNFKEEDVKSFSILELRDFTSYMILLKEARA
jgi:hypothetical protein